MARNNEEFLSAIRTIYGNRQLNSRTMEQLKRTWKENPNFIQNTAIQKHRENMDKFQHDYDMYHKFGAMQQNQSLNPGISVPNKLESKGPSPLELVNQRLDSGDMSMFSDFGQAFNEAKKRGQSEFTWRETGANPSGRFNTETREEARRKQLGTPMTENKQSLASLAGKPDMSIKLGNPEKVSNGEQAARQLHPMEKSMQQTRSRIPIMPVSTKGSTFPTFGSPAEMSDGSFRNTSRVMQMGDNGKFSEIEKQKWMFSDKDQYGNKAANPRWEPYGNKVNVRYQQQGGTMGANDQELQKAFMAFLIEDAAAQGMQIQSEQDLQAYAQQLGEEGLKAKYQEFMQKMQGGVKAALGAKLNYINKLKGNCPDGYEMIYMKQGGRVCPVCQKKAEKAKDGKKLNEKKNAINDFKEKRKAVNPNDTVNTKFGPRDLNGKTKYPKYNANKENYDFETRKRVQEKDEKSGKKVYGSACGSKLKKK